MVLISNDAGVSNLRWRRRPALPSAWAPQRWGPPLARQWRRARARPWLLAPALR